MWHPSEDPERTGRRKWLLCMSSAASYQRVTPQVTGRDREADQNRRQAEQPNTFRDTGRSIQEATGQQAHTIRTTATESDTGQQAYTTKATAYRERHTAAGAQKHAGAHRRRQTPTTL